MLGENKSKVHIISVLRPVFFLNIKRIDHNTSILVCSGFNGLKSILPASRHFSTSLSLYETCVNRRSFNYLFVDDCIISI